MLERFFPRENPFFDLFERHAARIVSASKAFLKLAENGDNFEARAREIKQIESEADSITHQCVEALYRTPKVPFSRDEVYRLITKMDDIVDAIEAAAERFTLYDIQRTTPESRELATVLVNSAEQIEAALAGLRYVRGDRKVLDRCIEINRLENEGDAVLPRRWASCSVPRRTRSRSSSGKKSTSCSSRRPIVVRTSPTSSRASSCRRAEPWPSRFTFTSASSTTSA
jgi:predicted phosphate transport protein (TIGR00153 family)